MMNLLHWRLLVAMADASQAIAQLEASPGFKVFTRERRHIGITALGEQVVEQARALVALEGTDEEVEAWLAAGTVELGVVLNPAPGRAAAPCTAGVSWNRRACACRTSA